MRFFIESLYDGTKRRCFRSEEHRERRHKCVYVCMGSAAVMERRVKWIQSLEIPTSPLTDTHSDNSCKGGLQRAVGR